jgi:uncharacterized protein (DUF362 family)
MSFYQCKKCKKTWQYNIEKCPDCFSKLEKLKNEKIKVIGVSHVKIPTVLHPDTPYFVLVLEDEKGNRWTQKTTIEYKIGDEFVIKTAKEKGAVAVWRAKYDTSEAIETVINLLGGIKINKESKILILPTLLSPKHPYFAENTSPQFLEATIKYLMERGAINTNIKVASQSFNDFSLEASAQKSQLLRVCLKNQITPLDLAKTNFIKKEKQGLSLEITEEAFNNDLVINMPIMKLDQKSGLKGATENILKLIKKEAYLSLTKSFGHHDLSKKIKEILPDYLTIAEGIYIQKSTKYVTFLGLVLASFDPFNLDRIFAEITMLKNLPESLKNIKIEDIKVLGRQIKELQYDVEKLF